MLAMDPNFFGAVVAHVPLFDMRRYHACCSTRAVGGCQFPEGAVMAIVAT